MEELESEEIREDDDTVVRDTVQLGETLGLEVGDEDINNLDHEHRNGCQWLSFRIWSIRPGRELGFWKKRREEMMAHWQKS